MYLILGVLAVAVGWAGRANWLTDWDSYDYTFRALRDQPSDLLLGRWWFIFFMGRAWDIGELFGVQRGFAFVPMQIMNILAMSVAVMGLAGWTYRLTKSRSAALLAGLILLPSPLIPLYASAVMTESLTLAFMMGTFLAWHRAMTLGDKPGRRLGTPDLWALLAGALFGIVVSMREPAVLLCFWPIVSCFIYKPRHPIRLLALALAGIGITLGAAVLMAWATYPFPDPGYWGNIARWTQWMKEERDIYSPGLANNTLTLAAWMSIAGPLVLFGLPLGALGLLVRPIRIIRLLQTSIREALAAMGNSSNAANDGPEAARILRSGLDKATAVGVDAPILWPSVGVAIGSLPYVASLLMNHDLNINTRFALPLVWMLAPLAVALLIRGLALLDERGRWRRPAVIPALAAAVVIVGLSWGLSWNSLGGSHYAGVRNQRVMFASLMRLPRWSVILPAYGTPVGNYIKSMDLRTDLDIIGSGWGFPFQTLGDIVAEYHQHRQPVYVNGGRRKDTGEWDLSAWIRSGSDSPEQKAIAKLLATHRVDDSDESLWPMIRLYPLPEASDSPADQPASQPSTDAVE